MRTVRSVAAGLAVLVLGAVSGCAHPAFADPPEGRARPSDPAGPSAPPPAPLPGVSPGPSESPAGTGDGLGWSDLVRDCAVAAGGSGLGTRIDEVMQFDATGDGSAEWLVVSECESTTSRWPQAVEVFASGPARLATLLVDDPASPRDLAVRVSAPGRVTITGRGLSPDAAACCPDLAIHRVFAWTGSGFTLIESADTPS